MKMQKAAIPPSRRQREKTPPKGKKKPPRSRLNIKYFPLADAYLILLLYSFEWKGKNHLFIVPPTFVSLLVL